MCDACFNYEIKSFPTQKDFLDFDLILTKKLANDKTIKMLNFVETSTKYIGKGDYESFGYQIFECTKCGQLWGFRDADNADRGFFKKLTKEIIDKDYAKRGRKDYGCLIAFIIIILLGMTIFWLRRH